MEFLQTNHLSFNVFPDNLYRKPHLSQFGSKVKGMGSLSFLRAPGEAAGDNTEASLIFLRRLAGEFMGEPWGVEFGVLPRDGDNALSK